MFYLISKNINFFVDLREAPLKHSRMDHLPGHHFRIPECNICGMFMPPKQNITSECNKSVKF